MNWMQFGESDLLAKWKYKYLSQLQSTSHRRKRRKERKRSARETKRGGREKGATCDEMDSSGLQDRIIQSVTKCTQTKARYAWSMQLHHTAQHGSV